MNEPQKATYPSDYSFASINAFVHNPCVEFEDMQSVLLGMACNCERLEQEVAKWKQDIIPFLIVHAAQYGKEHYGEGFLHATHYDLLHEAGARLDDFKRAE